MESRVRFFFKFWIFLRCCIILTKEPYLLNVDLVLSCLDAKVTSGIRAHSYYFTCSMLLQAGGLHTNEDFAVRGKEPKDEVQIYTWKDATLRELTDLVDPLFLCMHVLIYCCICLCGCICFNACMYTRVFIDLHNIARRRRIVLVHIVLY